MMVKLVFIVYCDVCDTPCCCVHFKCYSFTHVHCPCSLCVAPTFSFEGIKNFLTWLEALLSRKYTQGLKFRDCESSLVFFCAVAKRAHKGCSEHGR